MATEIDNQSSVRICAFDPSFQKVASDLVNQGLGERFGFIDETRNPDLVNIASHYASGEFLLAIKGEELVGTGSLMLEGAGVGRIARMHTRKDNRRQGIGTLLLMELEHRAIKRKMDLLVLETMETWLDAIRFYASNAYEETRRNGIDIHFEKRIRALPKMTAHAE